MKRQSTDLSLSLQKALKTFRLFHLRVCAYVHIRLDFFPLSCLSEQLCFPENTEFSVMRVSAVLTNSAADSSSRLSSHEEVHGDRIFLPLDFAGLCKNLSGLC